MMPNKDTVFLSFSELENYTDEKKYFCSAVVFSPETENDHFHGCPPYISIDDVDMIEDTKYFKVPNLIAYYAKTHPGYTMKGQKYQREQGRRELVREIKNLLGLE